jgi:cell division protein FtsW
MRRGGFGSIPRRGALVNRRAGAPRSSARRNGDARTFRAASAEPKPPGAGAALDGGVIFSAAVLVSLGLVMVFSTTAPLAIGRALPPHFVRHLCVAAAACVIVALTLRVPLATWRRAALPLWGLSVLLLFATLAIGDSANGAQRWLRVPHAGLAFQPVELAKWATILVVASALAPLSERAMAGWRPVRAALLFTVPVVFPLLLQPDFGNALVLVALVGLLLFCAGIPLRVLIAPALLSLAGAGLYVAVRPYALARVRGFLDPWRFAQGEGFQLVQSFVAFGRGEFLGVGLGDGRQKLFYLPEAHTDFILSVVAEELGLVGVLLVLGAFAAFVVAGTRIARRARDPFALLTAFGMTALIALPALVNAAVVMGLAPTKGFTLPFLSYGGNSLLVCALAVGILLRVGAFEARPEPRRIGAAASREGFLR